MARAPTDRDVGHAYDGIREFDNPVPRWWLIAFFLVVVFGYAYWVYYEVTGSGLGSVAALAEAQAEIVRREAAKKPVTDELLEGLAQDAKVVGEGQGVFAQNCVVCHGARGEGLIGPNLTDDFWLRGGRPTEIHKQVTSGNVAKGMPAWGAVLGGERVRAVVAFVLTMRGTNVAGRKAEGEKYAPTPAPATESGLAPEPRPGPRPRPRPGQFRTGSRSKSRLRSRFRLRVPAPPQ